jgi:hypothetical protein
LYQIPQQYKLSCVDKGEKKIAEIDFIGNEKSFETMKTPDKKLFVY